MRVRFCGVIEGEVLLRAGETAEDAVSRAEATIFKVLDERARSLLCNVGLEMDGRQLPTVEVTEFEIYDAGTIL